jgi:hypothetical protein
MEPSTMPSFTRTAASVLALFIIVGASAAAAPAAEVVPGETTIELIRTRLDGPASFGLSVQHPSVRDSGVDTMGAAVLIKSDESGVVTDAEGIYASSFGRHEQPTASSGGTIVNACTVAGYCQPVFYSLGNATLISTEDTGTEGFNRAYLSLQGFDLREINFDGDGWDIRISGDLTGWLPAGIDQSLLDASAERLVHTRYVGAEDADGLDVTVLGTAGPELFLSASLVGPAMGSVAFTLPPCSNGTTLLVAAGAGEVTLTGGVEPDVTTCAGVGSPSAATGIARGETTWDATGPAAGDTTQNDIRLVVFDLPGCRYLLPGVVSPSDATDC